MGTGAAAVRALLIRGMVAGVAAGLVAFVFARVVGEPALEGGIAYEDALATAAHEHDGEALVSRATQSGIGLAVAYLVYGVALGGILGLVHATAQGRLGGLGARATALVVALLGFVAVVLVPFLKYPANPPASSIDDTIGFRTGAFVLMVAASVVVAVGAVAVAGRLAPRVGWWHAVLAGVLGYVVVVGLVGFLLPTVAETPPDFPAVVLYDFRIASLGGHVVLWAVLAVAFAELVHRGASSRAGTTRSRR
ncbi:MAG: CbtA family protein [Pseudonocardia sp.]